MMLLSIYLIFCQLQPGVAYKSVAYKKKCVFNENMNKIDSVSNEIHILGDFNINLSLMTPVFSQKRNIK